MKNPLVTVVPLLLALSFSVHADDRGGMRMDAMSEENVQQAPTASAEGTIRAIDPEHHSITLAHGPVEALHWPPMTMGFQASVAQLEGLKVGDRVRFKFRNENGVAMILSIGKE